MPLQQLFALCHMSRMQVVVAEGPGLGITPLGGNGTAVWHTVPSVTGEEVFGHC